MTKLLGLSGVILPVESKEAGDRFLTDIGLPYGVCSNQSTVRLAEGGGLPILNWFQHDGEARAYMDPDGFRHYMRPSWPQNVQVAQSQTNTATYQNRVNKRATSDAKVAPVKVAHIALYVTKLEESLAFYKALGFHVSDSIKGRCVFLRCSVSGEHHDLLLVQSDRAGLHHLSLEMPDIYTVFSKGLRMDSFGWKTRLGPGRHPISSATFWYLDSPFGLVEIAADHDYVTEGWQPEEFEPSLETATEWAVDGGISHTTRRQHGVKAQGAFVDQHKKG